MKYLLAAAVAALIPVAAQAADYTEVGDAGQSRAGAQFTNTGTPGVVVSNIFGSLRSLDDADVYRIYIANPMTFSASAANADTSSDLDTALFLFNANGEAIAANDDMGGMSTLGYQAALPAGNALYRNLLAGVYYLGISNSGNEPTASSPANQRLFADSTDPTAVRGPAGNVAAPATLDHFDGFYNETAGTGAYRITLTGVTSGPATTAPVPEPSSWALLVGGFGLVGAAMRRRRAPPPLAA